MSPLYIPDNAIDLNPENNEIITDLQNQVMSNLADKDIISSIDPEILKLNSSVALNIVHNLTLTDNDIQEIKRSAKKELSNAKVKELEQILLKLKKGSPFNVRFIGWVKIITFILDR